MGAGHHFTVDVEEYFQVSAFDNTIRRADWNLHTSRVDASMDLLFEMLERHNATGTFFVLGWLAERKPGLVKRIAALGHEVASHGMDHRRVLTCTPAAFRESLRTSKSLLEDLSGAGVIGFRAPSFSIVPGIEWAFDVLLEEGYRYDSSLFPIRRPGYGYNGIPRDPHRIERSGGTLIEFPPATLRVLGQNLPAGGGAYFRIFPTAMTMSALRDCERRGQPGTFYIHPWELDPGQPRFDVSRTTRFRHYGGLARTVPRLEALLNRFRFDRTMAATYTALTNAVEARSSPVAVIAG